MTSRTMPQILKSTKEIFKEMGTPKNVNADNEFNKTEFNKLMKSLKVTMYYSQPDEINKNAIIERFNRTIASKIQLWRTASKKFDWYRVLPQLVTNYNNTEHRTVKDTPANIFTRKAINKQNVTVIKSKFKVGDKVRKVITKKIFDKGDAIKYSKEIYTINKIDKNKFYLTNVATKTKLLTYVKDYELKKANDVQFLPSDEVEHEVEHAKTQVKRKVTRIHKKEGIETGNISSRLRERDPTSMVQDDRFGRILWS
jgi:hypothetical protein